MRLSPPRKRRATYGRSARLFRSKRICQIRGRTRLPMNTSARERAWCIRRMSRPAWPSASHWWGKGSSAGSAKPHMRNSSTSRPDARTASASASGKAPPPHAIATGPASVRTAALAVRFFANSVFLGPATAARGDHGPPFALAQEGDDPHHVVVAGERIGHLLHARRKLPRSRKQHAIGPAERAYRRIREAAAAQTHHIEPGELRPVTLGGRKWDHVAPNSGETSHHGVRTDVHMLVHRGPTAHEHVVFDDDVAADHDGVGEDHIVADLAVVRHVRVRHEHAAVAHARLHAAAGG